MRPSCAKEPLANRYSTLDTQWNGLVYGSTLVISQWAGDALSSWRPATIKSRTVAFVLVVVIELLIIIMLLMQRQETPPPPAPPQPAVFGLQPAARSAQERSTRRKSTAAPARAKTAPVRRTPAQTPPVPDAKQKIVMMSKADYAASDIGALAPQSNAGTGAAGKGSGPAMAGPGEGPGGARLYNAEWHVEPSRGELAYYLPNGAPPNSWAMIACRTIAHYRVENCVGLGESPPGSGLARALRQASWQFRVRPPSVDGRPLIGSWVRIRFDWTEREAE